LLFFFNDTINKNFGDAQIQNVDMENTINENFRDAQIQNVDMEDTINENFGDAQIQNVDMEDTVNENFEDAQIQDVDMKDTVNQNFEDVQIQDMDMEDTVNFTSLSICTNTRFVHFTQLMKILNINFFNVDKQSQVFFVDGPGGTDKTFLYRALMTTLRNRGKILLATASSGIAATLLPGGRTAHSLFNLPFNVQPNSICNIKKAKRSCKAY